MCAVAWLQFQTVSVSWTPTWASDGLSVLQEKPPGHSSIAGQSILQFLLVVISLSHLHGIHVSWTCRVPDSVLAAYSRREASSQDAMA